MSRQYKADIVTTGALSGASLAVTGSIAGLNSGLLVELATNGTSPRIQSYGGQPLYINQLGNAVVIGSALTVQGAFVGNSTFSVAKVVVAAGAWNIASNDGQDRLFFDTNSTTYYKSGNTHVFRNSSNTDVANISASGEIAAMGASVTTNIGPLSGSPTFGGIAFTTGVAPVSTSNYAIVGKSDSTILNVPNSSGNISFRINDSERLYLDGTYLINSGSLITGPITQTSTGAGITLKRTNSTTANGYIDFVGSDDISDGRVSYNNAIGGALTMEIGGSVKLAVNSSGTTISGNAVVRGSISDDTNSALTISGGTSGLTTFAGEVRVATSGTTDVVVRLNAPATHQTNIFFADGGTSRWRISCQQNSYGDNRFFINNEQIGSALLSASPTTNDATFGANLTVTGNAFATTPANGTNDTQLATTAFVHKTYRYNAVTYFGMDNTGTTDVTAAVVSALTTIHNAGGGKLYFPAGTYRFNGRVLFPWTVPGGTLGYMNAITIEGDASGAFSNAVVGGTIFNFYDSATPANGEVAYFDTRGYGSFSMHDVVMLNASASSTTPFVQTTQTVLMFERVGFFGRTGVSLTTCNQDAVIFGGSTRTQSMGSNAPFSGYGTWITKCYFERIRTAAFFGTYANSIRFSNNTIGAYCGGGSTDAAIVIDPGTETGGLVADAFCSGNVIENNIFEMPGYKYGVKLVNFSPANRVVHNEFWDAATYSPAYCVWVTGAYASVLIEDVYTDSCEVCKDDSGTVTGGYTYVGGFANRLASTRIVGPFSLIVEGQNEGILFEQSNGDRTRISSSDGQSWEFTYNPHTGGGHTVLSMTAVDSDNSIRFQAIPLTTGAVAYYMTLGGIGAYGSDDGYDSYFGNRGRSNALMYDDSADALVAAVDVLGTAFRADGGNVTVVGQNKGLFLEQTNGDVTKLTSSDGFTWDFSYTPHTGGSHVVLSLAAVTSDNSVRVVAQPLTTGSIAYYMTLGGIAAFGSDDGYDSYFGNRGRSNALKYDDAADKLVATIGLVGTTIGPSTSQQHTLPAVASDTFALVDATQTLTNKSLAGTAVSTGAINDYHKAQAAMTGGGTITWGGSGNKLKWTTRFAILVPSTTSSDQFILLPQPTSNISASDVYTGVARTADANGVVLGVNPWEALYAVHTPGGSNSSYTWKIVQYGNTFTAPSNWILVAALNSDDDSIRLGTGDIIRPNGTVNHAATYLYGTAIGQDASHLHVVPLTTTDTFALLGAAQTLENKTITSPVINGVVTGSSQKYASTANDVTVSSTTFVSVTGLSFSIGAFESWTAEFDLTCVGDANGLKFQLTGPASPSGLRITTHANVSSATDFSVDSMTAFSTGGGTYFTSVFNGMARINLSIDNGANAGTVQLQFATASGTNTCSVMRGSKLQARRVA
jgi:hypothetical protein